MVPDDDAYNQGVGFGPLAGELADGTYPMSKHELLERYGDHELELEDGHQTLTEVLAPVGDMSFDSAEDVMQSTIGMVSDDAIGRKDYTDRGGDLPDPDRTDVSM